MMLVVPLVICWIRGKLLTLYQHISKIWLPSCGIKYVYVEEQDLGVWVGALDLVVFGL
jgi:hypothetical protein